MTKAFKYLSYLLVGAACATTTWSCSDDDYTMPAPNISPEELVEGVAFTVEHDAQNPNIIHLKSLMPAQYQVAWITPQGRKTGAEATLSIPFDGEYEVQMGVDTRGGYVWSNPYSFTVDDFCADFVEHYLWTRISGGVGQSKTWQLDLGVLDDGSVKVTKWKGPHWFYTNTYTWDNLHAANENETVYNNYVDADPWDAANAITPSSEWYWAADYPGNDWMCGANNYGYITFDLINGANVTVTDADGNVVGKGTYMLDTDAHTIQLSDVYPLETTDTRTHERFLQVLYLSDDAMQLMAPSEGVALNYVTKEYFENYSEPVPTEITLPEGWYEAFTNQIKYCSWVLDEATPFDWYNLGGEAKYGFKSPSSYPAEFAPVNSTIESFKLNMCDPASGKYTAGDATGDVSVASNGTITLSAGIGNMPLGGSTVMLQGSEFKVIDVSIDKDGRVESFVLGLPEKDVNGDVYQYLGYKLLADYGAEKVTKYFCQLCWFSTDWAWSYGEIYLTTGGNYTVEAEIGDSAAYGLYFDFNKILNDYPNVSITVNDIKKDGVSTGITDAEIAHTVGDTEDVARLYILNPWNTESAENITPKLNGATKIAVEFTINFDSGTPWVAPKAE
ncbi:MAG: hypothetical protein K2G07_08415 [Muribaculaceae bacterium]|nr:hypothetical protein [Muribaculaceae bacterium]